MMQMQPHLQHHSQPPMHPGQAQPQPPPHHMQMNPMAAAAQQQQQMMVQQQQQQMGMSPQQQQQQQMQQKPPYQCNMNGMMNMGMTPPQSHYMNQQMSHSQQQGQQHPQHPGHPMQQQQQPGGHMSPHQVAPPLSGSPPQQNVTPQQCIRPRIVRTRRSSIPTGRMSTAVTNASSHTAGTSSATGFKPITHNSKPTRLLSKQLVIDRSRRQPQKEENVRVQS
nr:TPR-containing protein DDB_G0280363-like isoform X1 [Aedes albopictus]